MSDSASPDITQFLAQQLATQDNAASAVDLALVITDVQVETSITAASILTITVADPDWALLTSGFLDIDGDGFLKPVEVQYPARSGAWWRLCMVDANTDASSANLTLTFEDRIVARLREKSGAKTATRGAITRAGFIRGLAREVDLLFVCPAVGAKARIDSTHKATTHDAQRTTQKAPGFADGASVAGLTPSQLKVAQTLLDVTYSLSAGNVVALAILCTGFGETDMGANPDTFTPNSAGYYGVLQGASGTHNTPAYWPDPHDTAGMAHSFCIGGKGFEHGGAIATAKGGISDPGLIAGLVQVAMLSTDPRWNDPHASGSAAYYGQFKARAQQIVNAYGGPGAMASSASSDTGTYTFTRGTTDDPHEDSWTCMNRLASEVNEFLFTNAQTLYYMSGPDMAAQKPTLYLDRVANADRIAHLDFTWDNTAFQYRDSHAPGKTRRRTRVAKADTPTEGHLDVLCAPDAYHAGEVVQLASCGPADGRWIIADATRSQFEQTTSLTLTPPTTPLPEPPGDTKSGSGGTTSSGTTAGADAQPASLSAGMTPKSVIDTVVLPIAAQCGIHITPAQVDAANAAHGPTVSGTPSDHQGPPSQRWAADMSNGYAPTPQMDRLADTLARKFGFTVRADKVYDFSDNPVHDGYRFQLGYRTTVGGNHFNHVHFGVERMTPDGIGAHGGLVP